MKRFVLASCAFGSVATLPQDKVLLFNDFNEKYGRKYETAFEKGQRFQIFSENVDIIDASNANNLSFKLGITANADRTFEEWRSTHLTDIEQPLEPSQRSRRLFSAPQDFSEPDSVDWVARGGVTSVKNQGTCGSLTFATTGALEGAMFVAGLKMEDLSMQHILACNSGGNGCGGGSLAQVYEWVAENGVPSLADTPYLCLDRRARQCKNMKCAASGCKVPTGERCIFRNRCDQHVKGSVCQGFRRGCECPEGQCHYEDVPWRCTNRRSLDLVVAKGDVVMHTAIYPTANALEAAVAQQPISVVIEADESVFQHYESGILPNDACGKDLDHGALLVGYGVDRGVKYWKLKNSWGPEFGEDGYIRIERGSASEGGECGIRKSAIFPTIRRGFSDVVV